MEPTTIIAIGSAVFSIGESLNEMVSDAIGIDGLALSVVNATSSTTLHLQHQSGVNDEGSHGKWVGAKHPVATIKPKGSSEFESSKSEDAWSGNTHGVIYKAVKTGCDPAYLWISWCIPLVGAGYYRLVWKKTWDKSADPNALLADIKDHKKTLEGFPNRSIDGLQKADLDNSYHATGTFGTAPLKIVVHD